jgi:hypothetical protein
MYTFIQVNPGSVAIWRSRCTTRAISAATNCLPGSIDASAEQGKHRLEFILSGFRQRITG